MKKWKWAFWILGISVAIWIYVSAASSLRGQMETTLSAACRRPVSVRAAQFVLPAGIRLLDVVVPKMRGEDRTPLSIDEIVTRYSVTSLTQGQPGAEIVLVRPKLLMEWTPEIRTILNQIQLGNPTGSSTPMTRLQVREGELTFVDRMVVPNAFWNLQDVKLTVQTESGSRGHTYTLASSLGGDAGAHVGDLESEGGFISQGPVDAKITLNHKEIKRLAPYLRQALGTAPSQGAIHLECRLTVHQGVLMAYNDVIATGIVFPTDAPTTLGPDGKRLVQLLTDREGKIHLSFIVTGKLGERLNWSDLATGALREAMRQAMSRSIQRVLDETEQKKPVEEMLRKNMESLGR